MKDQHLISVDELRAAGALDVPPEWRNSLGPDRVVSSGLFAPEHFLPKDELQDADKPVEESHSVPLKDEPAICQVPSI